MASPSAATRFGLSLTHNRLRVRKIDSLLQFYRDRLGMKHLAQATNASTKETSHFLGFSGREGEKYNRSVTYFELVSPNTMSSKGEMINVGGKDKVYWKIGVNMSDVDKAVSRLQTAGVIVSEPGQFRDIGYLCHLDDPDSYSIELLQFYFEGRKKPHEELPSHPLGQQPVFGMITLRVRDIQDSLKFYRDALGMKLLCKEDVSVYGFHLYFLAFTTEDPPNPDVSAEENREWTYQRPYTVIELQAYVKPPENIKFNQVGPEQFGFLGLGMGTSDIEGLRQHLDSCHLQPTTIQDNPVFSQPCFSVTDPDGIPIRFIHL